MDTELIRAHDKAKIKLLDMRATFFSSIVYSLKLVWSDKIPTAAVDGISLMINPDWYKPLPIEEKAGLLCHEAMHVALDHLSRTGDRDYKKFNQAADYAINNHLDEIRYKLPAGGLIDHQYDGMTAEQIYNLLPEPPDDYDCDIVPSDKGNPETEAIQANVKEILVRAQTAAEMDDTIGSVPGDILKRIKNLINPKLDWRTVLDRFMQDKAKNDYSWFKPNRRFFPDYYLPSLDGVALGHIMVAIDLSGSITDKDLRAFLSEIKYINDTLKPEKLTILGWDTRVSDIHEISQEDDLDILDLKFTGGGGTDIFPVMEWINKHQPIGSIIFTDGEYAEWTGDVQSDCIFIIKDNPDYVSNFGETVYYN